MRLIRSFKALFAVNSEERLKVALLSFTYFLIVGSYTLSVELKNTVFIYTVGVEYLPRVRIYAMFVLIPFVLLYSHLVDRVRRYQLIYIYCSLFAVINALFASCLNHPVMGLVNTHTGPHRILGWLYYFFVEAYAPFILGVFWAFMNSVTNPEGAKRHYSLTVAASKVGAMLSSAAAAFYLGMWKDSPLCQLIVVQTHKLQLLMYIGSVVLALVPVVIFQLMRRVPGRHLHGYEAAYRFEKKRDKEAEQVHGWWSSMFSQVASMFSGFTMFFKEPYVLGIFAFSCLYEMVYTVFSFLRVVATKQGGGNILDVTCSFYSQIFWVHVLGFCVALFGSQPLLALLGERLCLIIIPAISSVFVFTALFHYTPLTVSLAWTVLRAVYYGFSQPLKESLYIPTVKELKFKSKSWVDATGAKFARAVASVLNENTFIGGPQFFMPLYTGLFAIVSGTWFWTAVWLGNRYEQAIARNEVIGEQKVVTD